LDQDAAIGDLANLRFAELTDSLASADPTPGAGPSLACTCAVAAALVEMVSAVWLRREPEDRDAVGRRGERAAQLRRRALALADVDAAAYRDVLAAQRARDQPGHAQRVREALMAAADPLVSIVDVAQEVAALAADAAAEVGGGVRGEAITAAVLAAAVAQAGVPLVGLNLAGVPGDPRIEQVRVWAQRAERSKDAVMTGPSRA